MVKRPSLLVRETRSKGNFVKALSSKFECKPTNIPLTGSNVPASSNVPDTSRESMFSPVENVYVNCPIGFPSLLSTMASEKSTV